MPHNGRPTVGTPTGAQAVSHRMKRAKDTVNKVIPEILRASPRARHGVHQAQLFVNPTLDTPVESPVGPTTTAALCIRVSNTDTLTAARQLTQLSRRSSLEDSPVTPITPSRAANATTRPTPRRVCVLNMAAPARIGGAFLDGSTSQEEQLCMRTTLYPSLFGDFYPLPEIGGILAPDILVFRDASPEAEDLGKRERFYIDVISAAIMRFPGSTIGGRVQRPEHDSCSCGVSYCDRDRDIVLSKMRAVLIIAHNQGAEKIVLGAWGCGTYGHPTREIAKLWRQVLTGGVSTAEGTENHSGRPWPLIKQVVFAITDRAVLRDFERCFAADGAVSATEPYISPRMLLDGSSDCPVESNAAYSSERLTELVIKIQETEIQLAHITGARTRARLREQLAGLNRELAQVGNDGSAEDEALLDDGLEEDFVIDGFSCGAGSDQDETGYYNFDEDDIATSGSNSPASLYEFRVRPVEDGSVVSEKSKASLAASSKAPRSFQEQPVERRQVEDAHGWFSGSINSLSAMLVKQRGLAGGSPVLEAQSAGDDVAELDLGSFIERHPRQDD